MATNDAAFDALLPATTSYGWSLLSEGLFIVDDGSRPLNSLLPTLDASGMHKGGTLSEDLPLVTVTSLGAGSSAISVPHPETTASGSQVNIGVGSLSVPLPTLVVRTGAVSGSTVPVPVLSGHGLVGQVGSSDVKVPVAQLTASGTAPLMGTGSFSVPLVQITGQASFINQGTANITVPRIDLDVSGFTGNIGDSGIEVPLVQLTATGTFAPSGTASITVPLAVVEARGSGAVVIASQVEESESETFALSINLSNQAVSEYINYKFNSQTYFNGKYIGANTDGIFDLTGDDDAGTDIVAKIRTGLDDVGSFNLKRVWGVYLSHNAEAIRVKTVTESGDFDTVAGAKNRAAISVQKFKSQRTKRDGYWGVEISNVGGSDFQINSLEIVCEVLNRRAV